MIWRILLLVLAVCIGLLSFTVYTLHSAQKALENVPSVYTFGPPDADLEVVGFLDYSCAHCREAWPAIMEAVKKDGKVRFAPLLISPPGGDDEYAMRLTYAAAVQEKYKEAFTHIIGDYRPMGEESVEVLSLKAGLDAAGLREDIGTPIVDGQINKNTELFKKLGGQYTPAFFIGPRIKYVPASTPTTEDFLRVFQEARGILQKKAPEKEKAEP